MPNASKIKTYIVDDQPSMRALLRTNLRQLGVGNVTEFGDGDAALEGLKCLPAHLVISDCDMPKLDGIGLLKAVRADPVLSKIAFIMLTSHAEQQFVREAIAAKVSNYIVKPFSVGQLRAKIEAVLRPLT